MEYTQGLGGLLVGAAIAFVLRSVFEDRKNGRDDDKQLSARLNALEIKVATIETSMIDRADVKEIVEAELKPLAEKMSELDRHQREMHGTLTDLVIAFQTYIAGSNGIGNNGSTHT